MAATYAMPPIHSHVGHGHSHSRKTTGSQAPLQSPALNPEYQLNQESVQMNSFNPYETVTDDTRRPSNAFPDLQMQPNDSSHLQLPSSSSFSTSNRARLKSIERRKSFGLPTHLNLQGSGYGYVASSTGKFQGSDQKGKRPWISIKELTSATLVLLPCALASLVFEVGIPIRILNTQGELNSLNGLSSEDLPMASESPGQRALLGRLGGMTAMTLLLLGLGGKVAQKLGTTDGGGNTSFKQSLVGIPPTQILWRLSGRILCVGLPFYATLHLGGARVVTVLLLTLASNIMVSGEEANELSTWRGWKRLIVWRKWSITSLLVQMTSDSLGFTSISSLATIMMGYASLATVVFALPPPFMSPKPRRAMLNASGTASARKDWDGSSSKGARPLPGLATSPLISTPEDTNLTISAAILAAIPCLMFHYTSTSRAGANLDYGLVWSLMTGVLAAFTFSFADTKVLRNGRGLASMLAAFVSIVLLSIVHHEKTPDLFLQGLLGGASFAAFIFDDKAASSKTANVSQHDHHTHHELARPGDIAGASRFTNYLLHRAHSYSLLYTILAEKDSRRIFYFMCLNFVFMLVQTFYGIVSGSLGLLSDSIHMFFDCLALVVGLSAAVMSKWPPSTRFPYGYAKIETLAGFANGVFLMLISVEIIYEALERLSVGSNVKRLNELMTVSILGFLINVIGILAFGHAHHGHDHSHGHSHDHAHGEHEHNHENHSHSHGHGHGHEHHHHHHDHHEEHGHSHTHDHSCNDNFSHSPIKTDPDHPNGMNGHAHHLHDHLSIPPPSPSVYSSVPATPSKPIHTPHTHSHSHGGHSHHDHHHSENMMGIYLHVLGDTLGSAAVVLSTWLVQLNGWSGWDPLASTGIAIIIFGTAVPLVKNCARKLLLTVPDDTEYDLREALAGLSGLRGVVGCSVPKFWIQEGEHRQVMGVVHVLADKASNLEDVKERCLAFLRSAGLDVLVQVERDGVGRCWCQATR